MMQLLTLVELPGRPPRIAPSTRVVMLGSCFASHIGGRLQRAGLQVEVNPFGVVYNPESIALALDALMEGNVKEDWFFQGRDGMWHSWLHATAFSAQDKDTCVRCVAERLRTAREMLMKAEVVCLTFGTNRVYEQAGRVVGNCHKEPAVQFTERSLTVTEIVVRWRELLKRLHKWNSKLEVVFTVSPYRYAKYGLIESQRAKATLLLAVDELMRHEQQALGAEGKMHYFPAYEILLDELRDYRFYAEDMLHPSEQAVTYIWQRFTSWAFTPEALNFAREWERTERDLAHRPLNPDSDAHKAFVEKVMAKRELLKEMRGSEQ
ncbi:MAG: GSCFA domain-containing protein [Bacteroidaceae bacterium]|nr:GSCFA domain-containing protein [Bacteroidaceae bacterium]